MLNFDDIIKIDAHMHMNAGRDTLIRQAAADTFHLVSINTEVPAFPSINNQQSYASDPSKEGLSFVGTFSTEDWGAPDWQEKAIGQIKEAVKKGAIGIKVWKNIGMTLQDDDGAFVMIDHPAFDPIFGYCENERIPVLGHLGEPKNCWLPVEEMTVKGDRDYFSQHPEYHMHLHPEYPSYEDQLQARDRRIAQHPNLIFIGAHLASLEWSVEKQAAWLDRHPNAAMDMAERICHLQYQAIDAYDKVREFLLRYQGRLLYGTDVIDDGSRTASEISAHLSSLWHKHWKFFQSDDVLNSNELNRPFRGMKLPDNALKKIFRNNALKWYSLLAPNVRN